VANKTKDVPLLDFARSNYKDYGLAVLEDRAIPDFRDGMNPVNRKSLWSAHVSGFHSKSKVVKSARLVGDIMGLYHPHGDASIYDAIVKMTKNRTQRPLFHGSGNWGTMSGMKAAAMRYTETRLSTFSDNVIFNKFYLPTIDYVPNYDGSTTEPLVLPCLLPVALINGKQGIAPGARTDIPLVDYFSLLSVLEKIYGGKKICPKLLSDLKFVTTYGGREKKIKKEEQQAERDSLFTSTKGRVSMFSDFFFDEKKRTLRVTKFANFTSMPALLSKLLTVKGISKVDDNSDKDSRYATVDVEFKKVDAEELKISIRKVKKVLNGSENYILNFTTRYKDEIGQSKASITPMPLVKFFTEWVKWRTELEVLACEYWISETQKRIAHLDLLMLAVDNRKLIIESLEKTCDQRELEEWLSKKLKITVEQTATIYELRVKQLRSLEKKTLESKKKDELEERKTLSKRKNSPQEFMLKQLSTFKDL
jgi:DNA gyrase/topoisomerase IV subunit A